MIKWGFFSFYVQVRSNHKKKRWFFYFFSIFCINCLCTIIRPFLLFEQAGSNISAIREFQISQEDGTATYQIPVFIIHSYLF